MTRDEFMEVVNSLGLGASSDMSIGGEILQTVITTYEDDADEIGRTVATVDERYRHIFSTAKSVVRDVLDYEERQVLEDALIAYSSTPIEERDHWHMNRLNR